MSAVVAAVSSRRPVALEPRVSSVLGVCHALGESGVAVLASTDKDRDFLALCLSFSRLVSASVLFVNSSVLCSQGLGEEGEWRGEG